MIIHIHEWVLNGSWRCIAPNHVHEAPDIIDAASVWHTIGVISTHMQTENLGMCECGWTGTDYKAHLDDAVFFWLRDIDPTI